MRLQTISHRCHDWCGDFVVGKCGEQMNVTACNELLTTSASLLGQVAHGKLVFESNSVIDCVEFLRNSTVCPIRFEFLRRCKGGGRRCSLATVLCGVCSAISCCLNIRSACTLSSVSCGVCCAINCCLNIRSGCTLGSMLCRVCFALSCCLNIRTAGAMAGLMCAICCSVIMSLVC